MAVTGYSTQFPDGRLLEVKVTTEGSADETTTRTTYWLGGKKITKAEAEAEFDKQPHHWQRGRTFQQMLDFWFGRQAASR
jgi:hypothetical protein